MPPPPHLPTSCGKALRGCDASLRSCGATLRRRTKVVGAVVRLHPSTLIIPLIMLGAMLGVGLWGIQLGTDQYQKQQKQQAQGFAEAYMASYQRKINEITLPLSFLTVAIRQNPYTWPALKANLSAMMPDILKLTKSTNLGTAFVAPQGRVWAQYISTIWIPGTDLFDPTGTTRLGALFTLDARGPLLTGPFKIDKSILNTTGASRLPASALASLLEPTKIYILYTVPIFVKAPSSNVTLPVDLPAASASCGTPCTQIVGGEVFWGFAGISRRIEDLVNNETFASAGFRFRMTAPQRSQFAPSSFGAGVPINQITAVAASAHDVYDPVSASVAMDATNSTWTLEVSPASGTWNPDWRAPMIAVVVVVCFFLALMQFVALWLWRQHELLLQSLLPQNVLQQLQREHDFGGGTHGSMVSSGTPAETMLRVLACGMQGETPDLRDMVLVRTTLLRSADVYRPLDLTEKIKAACGLDSDVARALARQLDDDYTPEPSGFGGMASRASSVTQGAGTTDHQFGTVQSALAAIVFDRRSLDIIGLTKEACEDDTYGDTKPSGIDSRTQCTAVGAIMNNSGDDSKTSSPLITRPEAAAVAISSTTSGENGGHVVVTMIDDASHFNKLQQEQLQVPSVSSMDLMSPRQLQIEQVERDLAGANEWAFDAMALAKATNGQPLSALGFYLISTTGLMSTFKLRGAVLARFLMRVESLYVDNPYHSATHAADVLQSVHVLLQRGGLRTHYADPLTQLAFYLTAIVHDLGHPGRTNDFLITSSHKWAIRHNDKAPLENYHVSRAFELLSEPGMNFLAPLTREQRVTLRRTVIELVLATDMKQHFSVLSQFKTLHAAAIGSSEKPTRQQQQPGIAERGSNQHSSASHHKREAHRPPSQPGDAASAVPHVDEAGRILTLQLAMKCADLGHLSAPLAVHLDWVAALEEENFRQGDAEKAAKVSVSPLFDRTKPGITKSQVGFFNIVVLPQFRALAAVLPATQPLYDAVDANYQYWQQREASDRHSSASRS